MPHSLIGVHTAMSRSGRLHHHWLIQSPRARGQQKDEELGICGRPLDVWSSDSVGDAELGKGGASVALGPELKLAEMAADTELEFDHAVALHKEDFGGNDPLCEKERGEKGSGEEERRDEWEKKEEEKDFY
ncbi:hypothetical protein E2562_030502 [Oryza meyeriana var. granulata]|uniref:Uncharacterized protein n=1 Tax=Oryza meyeriana var. granulata TaxID=110450 RepID=A0A6G1BP36_9ORYZ|nr:hypothetical protein E2562_030502 [Oryza meyeriana var. granulata]